MTDRLRREYRFTTLPEHLIRDKRVSDRAVRLWCILDRYAGGDGEAFPLRATLADDLSCSVATVDRAINELVQRGWLAKERRGDGDSNIYTLLIAKAPKGARGKKTQVSADPVLTHEDRGAVTSEDTPVVTSEDTLSSPMRTPVVMGEEHKEESPNEASKNGDTSAAGAAGPSRDLNAGREDVDRLCLHLHQRLSEREVKHDHTSKRWRDAARLMLDADGRTETQVHNMIDWSQRSSFWHGVIHSMPNLREHYDKMRDQALRDSGSNVRTLPNRHTLPADDPAHQDRVAFFDGTPPPHANGATWPPNLPPSAEGSTH